MYICKFSKKRHFDCSCNFELLKIDPRQSDLRCNGLSKTLYITKH